jgi:hypothetical protein
VSLSFYDRLSNIEVSARKCLQEHLLVQVAILALWVRYDALDVQRGMAGQL